jgi:small-conductance mechanosensitive channel
MRILSSDQRPETQFSMLLRKDLIKKVSPAKQRKISSDQVLKVRDCRCKAINNLMTACSSMGKSKDFHKNIEKEKKLLKEWKQKMDQVTNNLLKLADVNQKYIETIYYFNKTSNEEILDDIVKLKSRREQNIVTLKKQRRRKTESLDT